MKAKRGEAATWALAASRAETDECVLWPFTLDEWGYARVWAQGRKQKLSHVILELSGRPRPAPPCDLALHSCPGGGNSACANPRHLRWGTNAENMADMVTAGRTAGESNGRARFSDDTVQAIRLRRAAGDTQRMIADAYGCSESYVSRLYLGRRRGGDRG